MKQRVIILGAGFGGLELCTILSGRFGDDIDITLIDRNDAFVFGGSKLDLMFGRSTLDAVRMPYARIAKPGVCVLQETVTAIDADARRITTNAGEYEGDVIVLALGADYDMDGTPGLSRVNEFYTVPGAAEVGRVLPTFTSGHAVIGVCGPVYKCPPAPSETAFLLHQYLKARGVRDACEITLVMPFSAPVPDSPETSSAILEAFAARGIRWIPDHAVRAIEPDRHVAVLDDGTELPFALFLGVPRHCVPTVVAESGLADDGWVDVNPGTLETRVPRVYAIGDLANTGVPRAGIYAENGARAVASSLIAEWSGEGTAELFGGSGACYVDFGDDQVGRVDVDLLTRPKSTGTFHVPSRKLSAERSEFALVRRERWFGS